MASIPGSILDTPADLVRRETVVVNSDESAGAVHDADGPVVRSVLRGMKESLSE
ncbi:MAG: hypothetical protein HYR60_09900 [Acidobacteria bacterium]|nr:hypothetical protein [Acidobacteriota bacterium]